MTAPGRMLKFIVWKIKREAEVFFTLSIEGILI
jgi:hypothetical protein